jgi:hypothetical protein
MQTLEDSPLLYVQVQKGQRMRRKHEPGLGGARLCVSREVPSKTAWARRRAKIDNPALEHIAWRVIHFRVMTQQAIALLARAFGRFSA